MKKWARNIVVGVVAAAFIILYGQPGSPPFTGPVAEVDGEEISREVFEFFRGQNESRFRQVTEQQGLEPQLVQDLLDRQTLDALVRRHLISREALQLGLWVSGPETRSQVVANPGFSQGGRFDPELFERFVVRSGLESAHTYTQEVRRDLLLQKFERLVSSPIRISRGAAEDSIRRDRTRIRLRIAVARPGDFQSRVEVTALEVEAYAVAHTERVLAAYQARIGEFIQPEGVKARHILFTGEDSKARGEQALARIRAGESFEELARELSDDVATKELGGDLGLFPRGRMVFALEEAAFALEPGEVSEPVETDRGIHLIRVEERQAAVERTLAETTPELARELLLDERVAEAAREAAERMAADVREGRPFEEAAEEVGLRLESPGTFGWRDASIPGLGQVPDLHALAFSLSPERPNPGRVLEVPDGFALISLLEREEPSDEDIQAELERVRERLAQSLRTRLMTRWFQSRRGDLERDQRLLFYPLYSSG